MKHLHKFASVLLALVMAFALMAPAFATSGESVPPVKNPNSDVKGPLTITISNVSKGHTYEAYQIFSGNVSADVEVADGTTTATDLIDAVLSNIEWGAGVNATEAQNIAKKVFPAVEADPDKNIEAVSAPTTAAEVAERLATADSDTVYKFAQEITAALNLTSNAQSAQVTEGGANKSAVIDVTSIGAGYYLVKDTVTGSGEGVSTDVSLFMLQVVGPARVISKVGTPEPDKKVKDINDSTEENLGNWDSTADHDVGDTIKYQLTAKLPANITDYKDYKLVFKDEMSKGLTLKEDTVKVYIGTSEENRVELTGNVWSKALTTENAKYKGGSTLTITFTDVLKITQLPEGSSSVNGLIIYVEYDAELNNDAVLSNPNALKLEYPSNPNWNGEGEPPIPNETPEKIAVVFTFKTVANKVTSDNGEMVPLTGAAFTLNKFNHTSSEWEEVKAIEVKDGQTSFDFGGLDDGYYQLVETVVPAGYNKIDDIYFAIVAEHSLDAMGKEVLSLKVVSYTPADPEKGTEASVGTEQLDSFSINMTEADKPNISTNVVNNQGATLPETGGIGTTIFYVVGGLLTVGAVVLLVTKKRMSVDSDK